MRITELKQSPKAENRWIALLDDGTLLKVGVSEIADFALYAGRELTDEEAKTLKRSVLRNSLRVRALETLSRGAKTRKELTQKLRDWGADEALREEICDRMEELGYLNDAEYARALVERQQAKGYGPRKIRDEFYRRGVPRELWDEALEALQDPAETLDGLVEKRMAGKEPDRKELQKVYAFLERRGFDWDDIRDALSRYQERLDDWTD